MRTLSPVPIDYDPSNGSWNVYCLEVLKSTHQTNAVGDTVEEWEVQPWAFQSLGHAMSFLQPHIASPLKQEKPGSAWEANLTLPNYFGGGHKVRITQLVMILK